MGVTSRMSVTLKPAVWSARSALSRPAPGPFTKTATERIPCSIARRQASSAASCAANGVDLREPLKPREPAEDHATVLPFTSVMVTTVLLNVLWMQAMPVEMFFLTFFLTCLPLPAAPAAAPPAAAFFALAMIYVLLKSHAGLRGPPRERMPLRGPLRVRALVWV